jgi:hypothetical protein
MIITAAYGSGTELGLWATLTPVSLRPRPVALGQDEGESDVRRLKFSPLSHADVGRQD